MNLYIRLIYTVFISWWQGRARIDETMVLRFRTWPHDLDLNLHMNNGRYLTLMDLGRMQLLARAGLLAKVVSRGWMPMIGEVQMRWRRALAPFQAFELRTRLVSWDEKWFFIEQSFYVGETLMAIGQVKGVIRAKNRNVAGSELLTLAGLPDAKPGPVPEVFRLAP